MRPTTGIDPQEWGMLALLRRMGRGLLAFLLAALPGSAVLGAQASPRQVRVAAASDLKWALEEVRTAFEKANPGVSCVVTFGSSGNLFAQLGQKAPFDVFFSADLGYPQKLVEQGLGLKDTLFTYAIGHLVVWVPKASGIPVETLGLQAVQHPAARRVSIANPRVAPYGRAAEAALTSAGLLQSVKDRLVLGDNIAQAAQFVQSGNADLGLLSLSFATSAAMQDQGRFAEVPASAHPPIEQGGVVLAWAQDPAAARTFCAFLAGPAGRSLLAKYGFAAPGGK